jgi:hypothetical protein
LFWLLFHWHKTQALTFFSNRSASSPKRDTKSKSKLNQSMILFSHFQQNLHQNKVGIQVNQNWKMKNEHLRIRKAINKLKLPILQINRYYEALEIMKLVQDC